MIRIPPAELEKAVAGAESAYPDEACGILFGSAGDDDGRRDVARVVPVENERTEQRERRYLISPEALREAAGELRREGVDIVGFYHSHPDHPAEPSDFDREHAWPWYTYLIVPVAAGRAGPPRAWRLRDDRNGFDEEDVTLLEEGAD